VEMLVLRGFQVDGQCSIRNGWGFQTGVFLKKQPALNFDFCSGNLRFLAVPKKNKTTDMGVSKNGGTPKWMVYDGKPY